MFRFAAILLALTLVFNSPSLMTSAIGQTFVHVDSVNGLATPSGPNPGDSWTNAYLYLQDGIDQAQFLVSSGYVVVRVRGFTSITSSNTYYPDVGAGQTNDLASSRFELTQNITILGNFIGGTGGDADNRDPMYLTVLSGDIGTLNTDADNAWHVVYAPSGLARNANNTPHMRGCVIRDGFADGSSLNTNGGGVFVDSNAEPYLRDCVITNNHAEAEGGGVWLQSGTDALLRSCTISDNDALFGGGFAGSIDAEAVILTSTFIGNAATFQGGGLYASRSPVITLINCEFLDNECGGVGGGIYVVGGSEGVDLTITNSLLAGNTAVDEGAGINLDSGATMDMTNCTLSDNIAEGDGGGLHHNGGDCEIKNSIIVGNTADDGDEIYNNGGNTIAASHSDIRNQGSSGVSGAITYTACIDQDPAFADDANGDYRLTCPSPCINTGLTSDVDADSFDVDADANTAELTPDLDLLARIIGADASPDVDWVDMGAYEKGFESCIGDVNNDGSVNVTDMLAVISAWGTCGSPCPTDIAPGGPCGVGTDGVTDVSDLNAVIGSWGDCEENLTGGGSGDIDFAAVLLCFLQSEELGLDGEEFQEFMQACMEEAGLLD